MLRGLWSPSEAADWRERLFAAAGTPPAVAAGGGGGASEIDGSLGSSKPGPPVGFRGRAQWGWRYEGPPDDPSLTDVANPHGLIFVQGTNLLGDEWFQLALEPRIVGAMTSVLGPDVNLHNMKASIKPPGHGTNERQGFHQDSYYIFEDPADGFCTLLLYLGASPTAADAYGATPLHLAAQSGAISIIELLLDGEYAEACDGALEAQDAKGRTPHAVAQEHKQAHAASALRSFDRRPSLLRRLSCVSAAMMSSSAAAASWR